MSAKGFWAAQDGHVVNILPPQNATGGVSSTPFEMQQHAHASIILQLGAQSAQLTELIVNAGTSAAMTTKQAIPFNLFKQETAGASNDVLANNPSTNNGLFAIPATGYQPSANANIFYIVEIDAAALPQGYPYVQIAITDGANTDFVSAVAILSAGRNVSDQSPTVTA
jgi:hypothetical protein